MVKALLQQKPLPMQQLESGDALAESLHEHLNPYEFKRRDNKPRGMVSAIAGFEKSSIGRVKVQGSDRLLDLRFLATIALPDQRLLAS